MRIKSVWISLLALPFLLFLFQNCGKGLSLAGIESSATSSNAIDSGSTSALPTVNDPLSSSVIDSSTIINMSLSVEIRLNKLDSADVLANYSTTNGTAISGVHFTFTSGSVTIPAGSMSARVQIPILKSEATAINFGIKLDSVSNGVIGQQTAVLTIPAGSIAIQILSKQIASGAYHNCLITPENTVKCWGRNTSGQLGNNSTTNRLLPETVPGLRDVVQISLGAGHSCALLSTGTVSCWGSNSGGQLGNNSTITSLVPVNVSSLSGIKQIAAGPYHTCAITAQDVVLCWGGSLGNGSSANQLTPTSVAGLMAVKQVSGSPGINEGKYSCAALNSGQVHCWGSNLYGQLGNNSTTDRISPAVIQSNQIFSKTSAGNFHACALNLQGSVFCWGLGNNGSGPNSLVPVQIQGLANIKDLSVGYSHTCVINQANRVLCWGANYQGQIGVNSNEVVIRNPMMLNGLENIQHLSMGEDHSCARSFDGKIYCWGRNSFGELGNNSTNNSLLPVAVQGL